MVASFSQSGFPSTLLDGRQVLDIGCGRNKLPGAVGLDKQALPGVDIVADLGCPLPFKDACFDAVHADQVLEHVPDLVSLIYEIHRILRPEGLLVAHVPYFRSRWAHIDPTHVRSFTLSSMDYFVKGTEYHEHYRFRDECFDGIQVFLDKDYPPTLTRRFFAARALSAPLRFENSFWSNVFIFEQLSYILRK